MRFQSSIVLAGAFALCVSALPTPTCDATNTTLSITAEQIIKAAPATASCNGGTYAEECADASRASIALSKSFETYGIKSTGEQAALLAYTLYESGGYKYNKNHFPAPGRPGQGTRMMAMDNYVKLYAIAAVGQEAVDTAAAVGGDAGKNAVLALVNSDDEKSFGSAAWFLSSQCSEEIKAGLASGSVDGWHAFLTECVGTTVADRDDLWYSSKMSVLETAY